MTIVFVAPFMTSMLRGIERIVYEAATRLGRRGHRVHILYWPGARPWPYGDPGPNVYPHQLPLPRYYQRIAAGMLYPLYLRRIKPDIVNVYYSWQGEDIAMRVYPEAWPATVLHVQYPAAEVPNRYAQLASSQITRRASSIVACSGYVAEGVRERLGVEPATIHNGVDTAYFSPVDAARKAALRRELGLPDDRPVLCTVGALEERKGALRVLESLALLRKGGANFHYVVVGEGPQRAELERFVADHGLADSVRLMGAHGDPRPFYRAADIFIFLSRGEAAPLAPLEAMACALPIVAADRPPLDEFLPRQGALFVDDMRPTAVREAIAALLDDPARRAEMGRFNHAYAAERYSWDSVVDRYESLYRDMAGGRGRLG